MSSCALIDLHVHLDGSIPLPRSPIQAQKRDLISLLAELKEKMQVPTHCQDLNQYLLHLSCRLLMQSAQGIVMVAKAFHEQLDAEGILYAEPCFAPGKSYCRRSLSARSS